MTSDALVKMILIGESCELYDRVRIQKLFKNVSNGYGKIIVFDDRVSITYNSGKSKRMIYNIPKELLTDEQLSFSSRFIR